uniref:Ubiquitin-like protease family profile domain-containing protein n=1 Tax=Tetradesmus obliquus TaxID=3088 RepID=A0A383VRG5_TETOB|eukprot:jgi/Sobl393_1/10712/SZX67439.1
MSDRRILSYHDVVLRHGDVELLRGPLWLNDQIIAFFFEYLTHELHPSLSSKVALMPGATTFLLLNSDLAESAMIFEALQLHEKELVLFAVNDNPDVEWAAGGVHWSCLAYHRASNSFHHYDSSAPHNRKVARSLAGAATPLVRSRSGSSGSNDALFPSFVEVAAMPQQQNSNDCGMYVLAVARALCDSLANAQQQQQQQQDESASAQPCCWQLSKEQEAALLHGITPAGVAEMRDELLAAISSLVKRAAAAADLN